MRTKTRRMEIMKRFTLLLIILVLTATFADAQFSVKIPKIKVPKIKKTKFENSRRETQTTQTNKNNQQTETVRQTNKTNPVTPSNNSTGEVTAIDSLTFFDTPVSYSKEPHGWYLDPYLKLKGDVPGRSALRLVVKKNGKELFQKRCELRSFKDTHQCKDRKSVITEIGLIDIDVHYVDGDTDKEKLLRKYKIDVRKFEKLRNGPGYYPNLHSQAAVGFFSSGESRRGVAKGTDKTLYLNMMFSKDYNGTAMPKHHFLRCNVNGQPIKIPRNEGAIRRNSGRENIFVKYESRHKTGSKKGAALRDYLMFSYAKTDLPLTYGGDDPSYPNVSNTPGNWECKILGKQDRKLYRTIRFEVSSDGQIVPHPEQRSGNVVLKDTEIMIDMEIPTGGSPIDFRLLPMPEMGLFFGIPWNTSEGKAMANRVPKVGEPYPKAAK